MSNKCSSWVAHLRTPMQPCFSKPKGIIVPCRCSKLTSFSPKHCVLPT